METLGIIIATVLFTVFIYRWIEIKRSKKELKDFFKFK
jgi:hypothetical protein